MTKKQIAQKRADLIAHLISLGYVEDRYGNYKRVHATGTMYRVKLQATSVRFERQLTIFGKKEWVNQYQQVNYIKYFHLVGNKMSFKKNDV